MKFGGRRKARGANGLLGIVVIGALVVFLAFGTWVVAGEMEQQRETRFVGSCWELHVNPEENGEWIMSQGVMHICSLGRFPAAGDREANAFWSQMQRLNGRVEFSVGGMSSRCGRVAGLLGTSGGTSAILTGGEGVRSEEESLRFLSSATSISLSSHHRFDAHSDDAGEVRGLSRLIEMPVPPAVLPGALVANQQGRTSAEALGAGAEEPAPPGLVIGLLCVAAIAGALVGRYAGYPAGKRERRK